MASQKPRTLDYRRCRFTTQLPLDRRYSPNHFWIRRVRGGTWRVGFTKFATRLLGELVEHGFNLESNDTVVPGQVIGWVEGFKALSDLACIAEGRFAGSNLALRDDITLVNQDPYGTGWLYAVHGEPGPQCVLARAYVSMLDQTIDRLRQTAAKR